MRQLAIFICSLLATFESFAQCASLRQQRNITFNTDKDCAPVTVTDFTITYFFNSAQDPADIEIQFEWNDPGSNVDRYGQGDGPFSINSDNTEFTATGTFTYPSNEDCVFEPVASILFEGVSCETSEQIQVVTSWARDNDFGGAVNVDPGVYNVCYNNAIEDAVFTDNSTFNCNINQEPDNPNRLERYTQFVYGTNHNGTNSISNLTLEDGVTQVNLTDGTANLSSSDTRSGVTAAYFGPIVHLPAPTDGPNMTSLPISAPADVDNAVGNEFEITLYNWNICNPYNQNASSPNYADAVSTTAYVRIVDPAEADYQTRLANASGAVQTTFCLGSMIYFENLSNNAGTYTWEFYDDATGTDLLTTSGGANPTFSYPTEGDKLVRLTASNTTVPGSCTDVYQALVTISPAAIAAIELYDDTFSSVTTGEFCVDLGDDVQVGFRDVTTGIESETEWRWEFYGVDELLSESIPTGAGTFGAQQTDFIRTFSEPGIHTVKLLARNPGTSCLTEAIDSIVLYDIPEPHFEGTNVCAGEQTSFSNIADSISSLTPRVNGDRVERYEWDLSFDGTTFNADLDFTNTADFEFFMDGSTGEVEPGTSLTGTYVVALRMTTAIAGCSAIYSDTLEVYSLPESILDSDYAGPICPGDSVRFENGSIQAGVTYRLAIVDSLTYDDTWELDQSDTTYIFVNALDTVKEYYARLLAASEDGCNALSPIMSMKVLPSFQSDFEDVNYSIFQGNCSSWLSTVQVTPETHSLEADSYHWTIRDDTGLLNGFPITINGASPSLNYQYDNTTNTNQLISVFLDVEKADACIDSREHHYIINPQPVSSFTVEQVDSCDYVYLEIAADQKGLPDYRWNLSPIPDDWLDEGDVQRLLYDREPSTGNDIGVSIRLVTENLAGCMSDTSLTTLTIHKALPEIEVDFELSTDTLVLPDGEVELANFSTTGLVYEWDFGDSDTSNVYDPGSHVYDTPGIYRINLTVSGAICSKDAGRNLVVLPAAPVIDFAADTTAGCAPLTLGFHNQSQYAIASSYYWEFGDGNTSGAENPVHTYGRAGVYTVRLYAENIAGSGAELIREEYITVFTQPITNFSLRPSTVYIPDQEVFFRNASENADSFVWDFGDGDTSAAHNPVHLYDSVGIYDISLIAANDDGCADTLTLYSAVEAVEGGREDTPNAFTPGGTGETSSETINDIFVPHVEGVTQFHMLIYNRWGLLLFESHDQSVGWDGYFQGKMQPADVYVYRLELTYGDGREQVKVGDVTLVR